MEMFYGSKGIDRYLNVRFTSQENIQNGRYAYHVRMLCQNQIMYLISPHIIASDDQVICRYDMNTYYVMSRLFRVTPMNGDMFSRILLQISQCIEELPFYLLDADNLVLDPEYMFYDEAKREVRLVYVPGYGRMIQKQLKQLLEYMMCIFDSEDRDGIQILYSYHSMLSNEGADVGRLIQKAKCSLQIATYGHPILEDPVANDPTFGSTVLGNSVLVHEDIFMPGSKESINNRGRCLHVGRLTAGAAVLIGMDMIAVLGTGIKFISSGFQLLWLYLMVGCIAMLTVLCVCVFTGQEENDDEAMEEYMQQAPEGMIEENEYKPVAVHALVPLTNGALEEIDFSRYGETIVVGRGKTTADYCLPTTEISRVHACIYKREGGIYVEDRDSTNGTYVNDVRIPSNEIVQLNKGDRLGFANEEFFVS
ncbi:MAG: DUF6382 domain-containing protein [Eubacteriales bacterium]|nr:DUF6382 domain-containing protein [Eubacteriales bacterium]